MNHHQPQRQDDHVDVQTAPSPEAAALPVFSGFDIEPIQEIRVLVNNIFSETCYRSFQANCNHRYKFTINNLKVAFYLVLVIIPFSRSISLSASVETSLVLLLFDWSDENLSL